MYIYFIIIIILLFLHNFFSKNKNNILESYCWIFTILFFLIFIGLRDNVGGDWVIYYAYLQEFGPNSPTRNFQEILDADLIFFLINKFAYFSDTHMFGVNFLCAIIFMSSMASFLHDTKNRWLGLAISFPIIILILGMGYTRQGLAFAFSLFFLKSLENKKLLTSFFYFILAIFSHKSALFISVFYGLYVIYQKKPSYLTVITLGLIIFTFIFRDHFQHLFYFYIGSGQHMSSYGSPPRSLLISIVAILFIVFQKRHTFMTHYQIFTYKYISYMILFIFPFTFISSITTDRLLLYLYPLKVAFISSANLKDKTIRMVIFFIISIYFLYFTVWIIFGYNAFSWLPYNILGFTFDDQGLYLPRHWSGGEIINNNVKELEVPLKLPKN